MMFDIGPPTKASGKMFGKIGEILGSVVASIAKEKPPEIKGRWTAQHSQLGNDSKLADWIHPHRRGKGGKHK